MAEKINNKETILDKIANGIMWWIGSIPSLVVHTLVFLSCFLLPIFNIVSFDKMLLTLTTILSLEAIYLAIFIQMSVNKSSEQIEEIQEDIEEIQEDIDEIQEDVEEIQEDIDEIQEDVEEINDDDDEEDHNEKARNVMLKSKVSNNKNEIKILKDKISELENLIEKIKDKEE